MYPKNEFIRIFDSISYTKQELPEIIRIDNFNGNTKTNKYQFVRQVSFAFESKRKEIY